jgi:hypothetical protein
MEVNSLSDKQLVCNLQVGVNPEESLCELVQRHSGIFITMVNNYSPDPSSGILSNRQELLSDRSYYIYQAALKYDESKNTKFSTHLGNETRWMCLNIYNKNKNSKEVSLDPAYPNKQDGSISTETTIDLEVLSKIISLINKDPDNRVSKIFKMRYIDGHKNKVMPWNKISKPLKLSIQGCINIHNKTIKRIKQELKKEL